MATQEYWADTPIHNRHSPLYLWFPTLDAIIAPDDPVRLVDEVLQVIDWTDWENQYPRRRGQPPIHPRPIAAAILYGLYRGIRSSRKLEEACNYRFDFRSLPERFLTDSGNNRGQIMTGMEQRNVDFYAPVESHQPQPGNPALRDDPHQPVPPEAWPQLPLNPQHQLDKSCLSTRSKRGRTITRDQYEEARERTVARMATPEGQQIFRRRSRIAETPFGIIKAIMGVRKFLLRGLDKVKTEWLWTVTAFNLMKLARAIRANARRVYQIDGDNVKLKRSGRMRSQRPATRGPPRSTHEPSP